MYKFIFTLSFLASLSCYSQSTYELKSQLRFCKQESAKFESDLTTYKNLLEIQGDQILELKVKIQDQESEIKNLKAENQKLQEVSIKLLELGMSYEEEGNHKEAIEIYKLLMRSYPHSMDSISAKMKIIELKKKKSSK